jgi:hypothetical protein
VDPLIQITIDTAHNEEPDAGITFIILR